MADGTAVDRGRATEIRLRDSGTVGRSPGIGGRVMHPSDRLSGLLALAALQVMVCGSSAIAQESHADQSEALLRWADSVLPAELPPGTKLPPPGAATITRVSAIIASSPLTGTDPGAGGSVPPASGASSQSPPPITIQLPPHPPERHAPSIPGKPPIQMPDPSSIPTPPVQQAPPSQERPPIPIPGASPGASPSAPVRPPILDPATIPLPPPPPEDQAPGRQGD